MTGRFIQQGMSMLELGQSVKVKIKELNQDAKKVIQLEAIPNFPVKHFAYFQAISRLLKNLQRHLSHNILW